MQTADVMWNNGGAEFAGWTMHDWIMTYEVARVDIAGPSDQ